MNRATMIGLGVVGVLVLLLLVYALTGGTL